MVDIISASEPENIEKKKGVIDNTVSSPVTEDKKTKGVIDNEVTEPVNILKVQKNKYIDESITGPLYKPEQKGKIEPGRNINTRRG